MESNVLLENLIGKRKKNESIPDKSKTGLMHSNAGKYMKSFF